jgi:hypothetical protein
MAVGLEHETHHASDGRLVVHRQNAQRTRALRWLVRHDAAGPARREGKANRGALAWGGLHGDLAAVALDDAEHHRQPQPGAAVAFGGEERLEDACLHLGAHAHA